VAIRILIVDDDPGFVGVAAELLAARGLEVIGRAGDADQALAAMTKDRPDGVLLDVNLPGRDGFATAVVLAACHRNFRQARAAAGSGHAPAGSWPCSSTCRREQCGVTLGQAQEILSTELRDAQLAGQCVSVRLVPWRQTRKVPGCTGAGPSAGCWSNWSTAWAAGTARRWSSTASPVPARRRC
jgi:CheY-like chemotaxis protein